MGTVLFTCYHVGELETVSYKVSYFADVGRRYKGRLDHTAHKKIADEPGVFTVSLVSFLRLGVLGVGKYNVAVFFKNVEDRDPVFACRFHADILTAIESKPFGKFIQSLCKGREPLLMVVYDVVGICYAYAGIDPGFVDIKSAGIL